MQKQSSSANGLAMFPEMAFLPSRSEVFGTTGSYTQEAPYAYYRDFSDFTEPSNSADSIRVKFHNVNRHTWWLRSKSTATSQSIVNSSGTIPGTTNLQSNYGVAPCVCIV